MSVGVGVVGCGAISHQYMQGMAEFAGLEVVACADLDLDRAKLWADKYGVPKPGSLDELLGDDDVEVVVNLTVPKAHHEVAVAAVDAGKAVYGEKPLTADRATGADLLARASAAGVLVGGAPDTFLGTSIQTCRRLLDDGAIGQPVGATLTFLGSGHEAWHPSPAFYYEVGGGPLLDMGPYYITMLVALLGPVVSATGYGRTTHDTRTIATGPDAGTRVPVSVHTHLAGALQLADGPIASIAMSFDVVGAQTPSMLYGTEGTLTLPDPNAFAAPMKLFARGGKDHADVELDAGYTGLRGIGVADLARAVRTGAPQVASGALAFHVLDVMTGVLEATESAQTTAVRSTVARPDPVDVDELKATLAAL
jgi:predicted dehydrogenase